MIAKEVKTRSVRLELSIEEAVELHLLLGSSSGIDDVGHAIYNALESILTPKDLFND